MSHFYDRFPANRKTESIKARSTETQGVKEVPKFIFIIPDFCKILPNHSAWHWFFPKNTRISAQFLPLK